VNKIISFFVLTMFFFACSAPSNSDSTTRNASRAAVSQPKASTGAIQSSDYGLTTAVNNGNLEITLHFAGGFNSPEFYTKHRTQSIIIFGYTSEFDFNGTNGYNVRITLWPTMNSSNQMIMENAQWDYITNNSPDGSPSGSVPDKIDLSGINYSYNGDSMVISIPIPHIKGYLYDGTQPLVWNQSRDYVIHSVVSDVALSTIEVPEGTLCWSREIRPAVFGIEQITDASANEWGFAHIEKQTDKPDVYQLLPNEYQGYYQKTTGINNKDNFYVDDVVFSSAFEGA
jgi:hypothetical protein